MASPAPDLASPSKRRRTQAQPFGASLDSTAAAASQPSTPSARRSGADTAGDAAASPGSSRGLAMSHLPPSARGQFQSALGPRTKGRPSRARLVAEANERRAWRAQQNEQRKARGEPLEDDTPEPEPGARRPRKSSSGVKRKRSAADDDDDDDDDDDEDEASASDGRSPAARATPSGRPRRAAAVAAQDSFAIVDEYPTSESESDDDDVPDAKAAVARAPPARAAPVAAPVATAVAPAVPAQPQALAAPGTPVAPAPASAPVAPPAPSLEPFEDVDATCMPGPKGWMAEPRDPEARWEVLGRIVKALRQERDRQGHNLAMKAGLLHLPEPDTPEGARLFAKMAKPTSLSAIAARVEAKEYASAHHFELDVLQMFESFRHYHEYCMPAYGATLHLQRYFQSITAGEPKASNARLRSYASIARGPNGALPPAPPDASQQQLPLVEYKGRVVRVGDWVHLASSDDPRRPHVGCVFKLTTGPTGPRIFVNWYARPSETEHSHTKTFLENEVFKTAIFVSHAASDLIDHCAVLFDRKYLRGRPKVSEDGTGWRSNERVYVCQDRWKTELKIFIKIKNWAQAMPDAIKGVDNLVYFPENEAWGQRLLSPFLRNFGFTGPGKLTDGLPPPGMQILTDFRPGATPARVARVVPQATPATPMPQPLPPPPQRALPPPTSEEGVRLRIASLLEQLRSGYGPYAADSALNVLGGIAGRAINLLELAVAIGAHGSFALGLLSDLQAAFVFARTSGFDRLLPPDAPLRSNAPRAAPHPIPSAWDVLTAYHSDAYTEVLPPATQALFDRDDTGRVRWYLGAPLDGPTQHAKHRSGALAEPRPTPSLEYLAFRAQRRADGAGPAARQRVAPKLPPAQPQPAMSAPPSGFDIERAFSDSLDRSAEHLSRFLTVEPAPLAPL